MDMSSGFLGTALESCRGPVLQGSGSRSARVWQPGAGANDSSPACFSTTMLLSLPVDVSLHVFAYLSLQDLARVRRAARAIDQFFRAHEDTIYHQAGIYHRFVRPQTALDDAVVLADSSFEGVRDWKELCRHLTVLERNWDGQGYVHEGGYQPSEDTVINFVIDEQERTAISLSRKGGLVVRALEDNRLLWALSKVRSPQLRQAHVRMRRYRSTPKPGVCRNQ